MLKKVHGSEKHNKIKKNSSNRSKGILIAATLLILIIVAFFYFENFYITGELTKAIKKIPNLVSQESVQLLPTEGIAKSSTEKISLATIASSSLKDKIIIYRGASSSFFLKYQNNAQPNFKTVVFGVKGDQYLMGDWDGDGIDEVGLYRNYTRTGTPTFLHRFILNTENFETGYYNIDFPIANGVPAQGDIAVVGDWDDDGYDTVGFYRPTQGKFFLSNTKMISGAIPIITETHTLGTPERIPIVGDWDGDGKDTIGVFNRNGAGWAIRYHDNEGPLATAGWGKGTDKPIVGDWDGDGKDNIGTYRSAFSTFTLSPTVIVEGNNNPTFNPVTDVIVFGSVALGDIGLAGNWIDCDVDDDGYETTICGGNDCKDNDLSINPSAPETCGDIVDNDCDGIIDDNCDLCENGPVRCNFLQPERCKISSSNIAEYSQEGDTCGSYYDCEAVELDMPGYNFKKGITGCASAPMVYGGNTISNEWGTLIFPSTTQASDFSSDCIAILKDYVNINVINCPNLIGPVNVFLKHTGPYQLIMKTGSNPTEWCDPINPDGNCPMTFNYENDIGFKMNIFGEVMVSDYNSLPQQSSSARTYKTQTGLCFEKDCSIWSGCDWSCNRQLPDCCKSTDCPGSGTGFRAVASIVPSNNYGCNKCKVDHYEDCGGCPPEAGDYQPCNPNSPIICVECSNPTSTCQSGNSRKGCPPFLCKPSGSGQGCGPGSCLNNQIQCTKPDGTLYCKKNKCNFYGDERSCYDNENPPNKVPCDSFPAIDCPPGWNEPGCCWQSNGRIRKGLWNVC